MLRLVLLVLYLIAPSASRTLLSSVDAGGGYDPNGVLSAPAPLTPTGDYGAGYDPNG